MPRHTHACSCLAVLALTGCGWMSASRSATDASRSPAAFSVAQDYEGAYRRVLENARRCWPAATAAGQRDVQGTVDNEGRSARVALAFRSREGADTRLVVDLKVTERARTDVRISGPADPGRPAAAVRAWLEGTSLDCP